MKIEQLNWNKFHKGIQKKVDVAVDDMMHRVLNNIGKRQPEDNPLHQHVMNSPKRIPDGLLGFKEFVADL